MIRSANGTLPAGYACFAAQMDRSGTEAPAPSSPAAAEPAEGELPAASVPAAAARAEGEPPAAAPSASAEPVNEFRLRCLLDGMLWSRLSSFPNEF